MIKKVPLFLRTYWMYVLMTLAVGGFIGNVLTYYPGYMSNDSIGQLGQSLGVEELVDLTPIAMVSLWSFLILVTGKIASLLIVQLSWLWLSLGLLSVFIYRQTKSRKFSLLPLAIGILPMIVNIAGVIWKDNQMAFALLLAVSLVLWMRFIHSKIWRSILLSFVVVLVAYAALVRYNALMSVVPIVFLAIRESGLLSRIRWQLLSTFLVMIAIAGTLMILPAVTHAKQTNAISAVMLDDIVQVVDRDTLQKSDIPEDLKKSLLEVQVCAESRSILLNNFWVCTNDEQREVIQYTAFSNLKSTWARYVIGQPFGYALYRLETYMQFVFPPDGVAYIWQDGIIENNLGQSVKFERLGNITSIYVNNFAYRYFTFLFEPWFWIVVTASLLLCVRKYKRYSLVIYTLLASSTLYLLSYLPTGATPDYRYIYWSVLALLVCAILLFVDYHLSRKNR